MIPFRQRIIYDEGMNSIPMMDLVLLRSFMLLSSKRSVTDVANTLSRTQPAISLQMKRLETAAGCRLFEGDLRNPTLTAQGEILLGYAQEMLYLHDRARTQLKAPETVGKVILGCPDLYAFHLLPNILASFRRGSPGVEVEVKCALSLQLASDISYSKIDLAIATSMPGVRPTVGGVTVLGEERLAWFGAQRGAAWRQQPLPLAMLPGGNLYRDLALAALEKDLRSYRISGTSESIAGLHAMTVSDSCITVLSSRLNLPGVVELGPREGLPPLPAVNLLLWNSQNRPSKAAQSLAEHIKAHWQDA